MTLSLAQLPDDVASLKALFLAAHVEARADNVRLTAETARLTVERDGLVAGYTRLEHDHTILSAEVDRLTARNERLDHILQVLRRGSFILSAQGKPSLSSGAPPSASRKTR